MCAVCFDSFSKEATWAAMVSSERVAMHAPGLSRIPIHTPAKEVIIMGGDVKLSGGDGGNLTSGEGGN